ncbi:unnamed protein product, partial [Ectocarpus sp. 12 AP-2014]
MWFCLAQLPCTVPACGRLLTIEARTTREENHDVVSNSADKG